MEQELATFVWAIRAVVPNDDLAGAVFALRDNAFERAVVERMILDHHGETFFTVVEGRAFGDGPGLEDAVQLQTEVIMQTAGVMLLDEERERSGPPGGLGERRLRRQREVTLIVIFRQVGGSARFG